MGDTAAINSQMTKKLEWLERLRDQMAVDNEQMCAGGSGTAGGAPTSPPSPPPQQGKDDDDDNYRDL